MISELSPRYNQDLSFENLTSQQFLVIIVEAAKNLNWKLGPISEIGFIGYRNQSNSFRNEELKVEIDGKNANLESRYTGLQIINASQNKENIENLVAKFIEVKNTINPNELELRFDELRTNFVSNGWSLLSRPPSIMKDEIEGIVGIFKPRPGYYFTPILIDLNCLIFFLMVISRVNFLSPDETNLIKWGANFTPLTLAGDWWRLLTSCFLHLDFLHLFMNMYALMYIGLLMEPILGKSRFVLAYLVTGIVASITSLWWHDKVLSLGASGAIFGMYGVFLAMLTTNLIQKASRSALLMSISIFVIYSLIGGMTGGIDNAAHFVGLICGVVIGYAYYPGLKNRLPDN